MIQEEIIKGRKFRRKKFLWILRIYLKVRKLHSREKSDFSEFAKLDFRLKSDIFQVSL